MISEDAPSMQVAGIAGCLDAVIVREFPLLIIPYRTQTLPTLDLGQPSTRHRTTDSLGVPGQWPISPNIFGRLPHTEWHQRREYTQRLSLIHI